MNERVLWRGDRNPLTEQNLTDAAGVWVRGGDYAAVPGDEKCFIRWGKDKAVLLITAREPEPGSWELVMSQNPKMGPFPDKVMDRFVDVLRDVTGKLTQDAPSPRPE